jgi:polyhydroxybutyrate depolymerase
MIRVLAPALVAASALFAACAGGPSGSSGAPGTVTATLPQACAPARSADPGDYVETLDADGERRYFVHVPKAYAGDVPVPVVLAFSASAMPGPVFAGMSRLPHLADTEGFVLVVLEASDGAQQSWNTRASPDAAEDRGYANAVIDAVVGTYCVDDARIYAAGYSDGGGMTQDAACAMPERIAAVAVVASTYVSCTTETPLLAFHGLADPLVPYEGGALAPPADQAQASPPVRRAVTEWARALGCDALATISRPSSEVELSTFKRCRRGDGVVLLYSVIGGGHTWPGSPPLVDAFGFSTRQLDASDEMWRFFAAFPRE